MPDTNQSIREIIATQASAAGVFKHFNIDICLQGDNTLNRACAELQLSVDQVLEKLANAEAEETGSSPIDPGTLSTERLIQKIVRVHHQNIRQELPRLAEMAMRLAEKHGDRSEELTTVAELLEKLRTNMIKHIQQEEQDLFPFITQMDQKLIVACSSEQTCSSSLSHTIFMLEQEHESASRIVAELRRITRGFNPPEWACATHIALFSGLRTFEGDLKQHLHLENDLLFPRAIHLDAEQKCRG